MYGKVLTGLNIRSNPYVVVTPTNIIGSLRTGDLVEASLKVNGWWSLTKIVRNNVSLPLPANPCYSYEGDNQGFIQTLPPPVVNDYIVHFVGNEQHRYERAV